MPSASPPHRKGCRAVSQAFGNINPQHASPGYRDPDTGTGIGVPRITRAQPMLGARDIDEYCGRYREDSQSWLEPASPLNTSVVHAAPENVADNHAIVEQRMTAQQQIAAVAGAGTGPEGKRRRRGCHLSPCSCQEYQTLVMRR